MVQARLGLPFDRNGALTRAGRVDAETVAVFLDDVFFRRIPPKSLDREGFPQLKAWVAGMETADAVATLAACAAGGRRTGDGASARAPPRGCL